MTARWLLPSSEADDPLLERAQNKDFLFVVSVCLAPIWDSLYNGHSIFGGKIGTFLIMEIMGSVGEVNHDS